MVRQELREVGSDFLSQCFAVNAVEGVVQVQTQERSVRRCTQGCSNAMYELLTHRGTLDAQLHQYEQISRQISDAPRVYKQAPSAPARLGNPDRAKPRMVG
mmetsp:Transcript_2878/g.13449  ORF Transcript_2878/g.13449 Transcript_2878/m.13449 type:complete len:101 (-) Transcript_2878:1923-2225(-)